ncbi:hypothetical protein MB02_13145 [Croceicoccus estronivorus]|uniref:DUF4396 domain-containing protein n=1 Tax=Croceicoccus estronivorus TaxID=1172626 RepID=UPI000832B7D4|nr:DUF4396 domain-containing protein [Croceicoccus estronivorus]OCC23110.1 hypothetical protein MB02_13145 [Croceicoccus estronivorus]
MQEAQFPGWLHTISILSLALAGICAAIIVIDTVRRPQKMWIMNVVWPLTALFGSVVWLLLYLQSSKRAGDDSETAMPVAVAKGASHCGAGCTLGDIVAEWAAFALPTVAVWFGWHSLFSEKIFAVWVLDYIVAFAFGVAFQYFTIKPMRGLSTAQGLVQAIKADAASITSWQVGMYGLMAIVQFAWFRPVYGGIAHVATPEFWFAMQLAMLAGFCTAYPVNWWLVKAGIKERM